ncbi:unnamed protein product [Mycena citricolor]|uniref:Spindle pole body component n=1 Tax=Mycena citricolor TaxID=2018698 RepID=A0AAD2HSK0_9AGAR|nr:unnamed protein product [Mycena citricolor]
MTVLGLASPLHVWDETSETFVTLRGEHGEQTILVLDDKDEMASSSYISRFLAIGTLMRRLENFVVGLRSRFSKEGPTIHAFMHTLTTVLVFLRESLSQLPSDASARLALVSIWSRYELYERLLNALADLCGRSVKTPSSKFTFPDPDPISLLSLIYDRLEHHLNHQSSRTVTALMAFLLSRTSREYLDYLARSVGLGPMIVKNNRVVGEQNDQYTLDAEDDMDNEDRVDWENVGDESFPTFFPAQLASILPAAQKSLVLLRAAEPDHPLLSIRPTAPVVQWLWAWTDIEDIWNGQWKDLSAGTSAEALPAQDDSPVTGLAAQFRVFDLEPGAHLLKSHDSAVSVADLQAFMATFPENLPPITPTLGHLTVLVFEPLMKHASALSGALLTHFLIPTASVQIHSQVELLSAYLLLGKPAFRSRVSAALFSDAEGREPGELGPVSVRGIGRNRAEAPVQSKWPVGLSFSLLERQVWPPVGADLSFFLRTVIVDSFEASVQDTPQPFWIEAERRLGFAIRDLPVVPGHDQWMNPMAIEALDFLYMDYKAPHPMDIVINQDVLSKYQRMFTYLLRIIRVEHAIAAVFRMTRLPARPIFQTLVKPHRVLLHFRFIAHKFVSCISAYVFDTAIRGNLDPFLARLSPDYPQAKRGFGDVFALARMHSSLLDDVLSACLLRSAQRMAGDLLRQALQLVLDFAVLVGERCTGRLEEYQAEPELIALANAFRSKVNALIQALKMLAEKGSGTKDGGPTGGLEAIPHLLELLSEWWTISDDPA